MGVGPLTPNVPPVRDLWIRCGGQAISPLPPYTNFHVVVCLYVAVKITYVAVTMNLNIV